MSQHEGEVVRRQLLGELHRLSDKYPDLRIGQLILNATSPTARDLYYLEDSVLLGFLVEYDTRLD